LDLESYSTNPENFIRWLCLKGFVTQAAVQAMSVQVHTGSGSDRVCNFWILTHPLLQVVLTSITVNSLGAIL
jgi:hypothetical protein